jgi:hypothetical protein
VWTLVQVCTHTSTNVHIFCTCIQKQKNVIQASVLIGSSFQQVQQAMLTVVTTGTLKSIANSREFIFPLLKKMNVPFVVWTGDVTWATDDETVYSFYKLSQPKPKPKKSISIPAALMCDFVINLQTTLKSWKDMTRIIKRLEKPYQATLLKLG